jgi:hypothetical protein
MIEMMIISEKNLVAVFISLGISCMKDFSLIPAVLANAMPEKCCNLQVGV